MNQLQETLNFLLDKYSVGTAATLVDRQTVTVEGHSLPLLSHRQERRFTELRNLVHNGTLQGISVMRVARIVPTDTDLDEVLYREFDLCQYLLGRRIVSVMTMQNGSVMNLIATTEDGVVCTIELAATLRPEEKPKDKHEIIARRGIACDVVVDAQLKQDSVYVFGADGDKQYTDVDFELYGLSVEDIAVVRAAFAVARDHNVDELTAVHSNLLALVVLARQSAVSGEREVL